MKCSSEITTVTAVVIRGPGDKHLASSCWSLLKFTGLGIEARDAENPVQRL